MACPPSSKTGLVIIRAWVEENVPGFRARVIQLSAMTGDEEVIATVATAEQLTAAVENWLQRFLHCEQSGRPGS
jgi:hypothetical protein